MLESIYAEITEKCNLACKHCYNCSGRGKTLDMEYSSFTNMIDQMAELGGTSLAISGGELFLHPDINKILYFLSEKKMMKIVLQMAQLLMTIFLIICKAVPIFHYKLVWMGLLKN